MVTAAILAGMRDIIVIAHDIRSCHNVGSLLRTAEGLGISQVLLSGYTPYPLATDGTKDDRLPHISAKIHRQISKTALGAEVNQVWRHCQNIDELLAALRHDGYTIAGLEQTSDSISLPDYPPPPKLALLLGREVEGLDEGLLSKLDLTLEIPMFGTKESFNVVQAAAMALFHCRFYQ